MDKVSAGEMVIPTGKPAPGRGIHRGNGYSVGNNHLMVQEFVRGIRFYRELPAHGRRIQRRNGILKRITSSWTRNLIEEWNSAGNCQHMDEESNGGMGI
jgi:hypothetical protein